MQSLNDFLSNSILYGAAAVVGWMYILKTLNRSAPSVTSAAKRAATSKAVDVLSKLFK